MNTDLMFSSKKTDWTTPKALFNTLNKEFNFTLDPSASDSNHLCAKYFTIEDNGLAQNWEGETVFCNPPYGRGLKKWVKKCCEEGNKPNTTVVLLIPARTDTSYQHDYVFHGAKLITFVRGRIKFGECENAAPYPSQLIVFSSKVSSQQINALNNYGYTTILC